MKSGLSKLQHVDLLAVSVASVYLHAYVILHIWITEQDRLHKSVHPVFMTLVTQREETHTKLTLWVSYGYPIANLTQ